MNKELYLQAELRSLTRVVRRSLFRNGKPNKDSPEEPCFCARPRGRPCAPCLLAGGLHVRGQLTRVPISPLLQLPLIV